MKIAAPTIVWEERKKKIRRQKLYCHISATKFRGENKEKKGRPKSAKISCTSFRCKWMKNMVGTHHKPLCFHYLPRSFRQIALPGPLHLRLKRRLQASWHCVPANSTEKGSGDSRQPSELCQISRLGFPFAIQHQCKADLITSKESQ